jgi:MscS family membrane protein
MRVPRGFRPPVFCLVTPLAGTVVSAQGAEGPGRSSTASFADWVRTHVPDLLQGRSFLLEHWQWAALVLLAFAGVVVDRLIRYALGVWLRKLLSSADHGRIAEAITRFEKPIGILTMAVVWWLLLGSLDLPPQALETLRFATRLMMAGAGVWAAYRFVDLASEKLSTLASRTESRVDDILVPLVRRALKIAVLAFGVLFVAQNLDIDITSLLAGLGLGGLAFALAAKDTVENLFGSVTVLIDRPFQIGDWVVIDDLEGTVEEIGFRSTRIRTFYNSVVTVPNSRLVNTAVDNLGARRYRRLKCMIGVQYDTDPERLDAFCEGIRELIRLHPYTRKDYYMVYFNEFSDSSLNVLLYVFFDTPDWATELRERHRLLVDIVRLARRLGVQFAFPTRTLHLASVPPGTSPEPHVTRRQPGDFPSGKPVAGGDTIRLGRTEAEEIVRGTQGEDRQLPVDFGDPDRIRPGL